MDLFGFYDENKNINLVYPDLLYKAIMSFYSQQGLSFPWKQSTMCTELLNQGFLYKTPKQNRPQMYIKNPRSSRTNSFIGILADKIHITCRYNENGSILTK